MVQEDFKRKLTAIFSADVEGYSRLMDDDEEATVRTLTSYRIAISDFVQQFRGRIIDTPGDNILADFTSVVDAVNCAVEIQRDLAERNAELPDSRKMQFRIGVNLGDVIDEDGRIYGDGVNIAARVESIAEAGGICISGRAYDQVENKLGLEYEDLGKHEVKNISRPIQVYRVLSYPGAAAHRVVRAKKAMGGKIRKAALALTAVLLIAVGAVVLWKIYLHPSMPPIEAASAERMAFPLPTKPSIAVLPFVNMSEDTNQEYFSDGITEDLITDLSKISGLFVIARNSVFSYKNKPVQIRQVAEELGVRYILEGSVRRAANHVRINAQLIDATTGGHLWAERYDGKMKNVFALQDRITQKIVSALEVKLTAGEEKLVARKDTDSAKAYEAFLQGWVHYWQDTREDIVQAIPYLEKAVKIDPDYSRAYSALAASYWRLRMNGWSSSMGLTSSEALEKVKLYLQEGMKDPLPLAYLVTSSMRSAEGRYQESIVEATRAIVLDSNDPVGYIAMGKALVYAGRPKEGADAIKKAMRLNPHYPPTYLRALGFAQFSMEQFEEAATSYEESIKRDPNEDTQYFEIAGTYGQLGREEQARSALKTFNELRAKAGMNESLTVQSIEIWGFKEHEDIERWRTGLRLAGVPPGREPVAAAEDLIYHTEKGPEIKGATTVEVATAKALFDRGVPFVDVQEDIYYAEGHIPGAISLDPYKVFNKIELSKIVRKDKEVVIYCSSRT